MKYNISAATMKTRNSASSRTKTYIHTYIHTLQACRQWVSSNFSKLIASCHFVTGVSVGDRTYSWPENIFLAKACDRTKDYSKDQRRRKKGIKRLVMLIPSCPFSWSQLTLFDPFWPTLLSSFLVLFTFPKPCVNRSYATTEWRQRHKQTL